jgi:hypothetical protein
VAFSQAKIVDDLSARVTKNANDLFAYDTKINAAELGRKLIHDAAGYATEAQKILSMVKNITKKPAKMISPQLMFPLKLSKMK